MNTTLSIIRCGQRWQCPNGIESQYGVHVHIHTQLPTTPLLALKFTIQCNQLVPRIYGVIGRAFPPENSAQVQFETWRTTESHGA